MLPWTETEYLWFFAHLFHSDEWLASELGRSIGTIKNHRVVVNKAVRLGIAIDALALPHVYTQVLHSDNPADRADPITVIRGPICRECFMETALTDTTTCSNCGSAL